MIILEKSRIKEIGKYICYIAKSDLIKKVHCPDIVLIPYKKYQKKGSSEMRLKFLKYSDKNKTVLFKITKRDHKF